MPVADDWEESCCGHSVFWKGFGIMKHSFSIPTILTLLSLIVCPPESLPAQPSAANQVITLQVLEFSKLAVFSATTVVAFLDDQSYATRSPETDRRARLAWTSNGEEQKITVACLHTISGVHLRVLVREWRGSREAEQSSIELSDALTHDLFRGLSRSAGGCELQYSLRAFQLPDRRDQVVIYTVTSG